MNDYTRILYRLAFMASILITTALMMNSSESDTGQKVFKPKADYSLSEFGDNYEPESISELK